MCATGNIDVATQVHQYGVSCEQPGLDYFRAKFTEELKESVDAFKAARLFVPQKVVDMEPNANAIDSLAVFLFFTSPILSNLMSELPEYLVKAADASSRVCTIEWWEKNAHCLPHWSSKKFF